MIAKDENALTCDFMETYHVLDYRSLGAFKASVLANGLPDNIRIKRKLAGVKHSTDTLLLAAIADRLSLILWTKTEDGQKNRNRPASIYESLTKEKAPRDFRVYDSIEAFNAARNKLMEE